MTTAGVVTSRKIRVLIVDDSATVRSLLTQALSHTTDIEVVGTAPDPYVAREKVIALQPDVLTLDIEMPRMDGLTFLRKLLEYKPIPVIMISSLSQASCSITMEALRMGAVEVLGKPNGPNSVGDFMRLLPAKVRSAAAARVRPVDDVAPAPATLAATKDAASFTRSIIALGASTGGPQTLIEILQALPAHMPPIVVTQHMPAHFTAHFAARLNQACALEVREAVDGDVLHPGLVLVAPGGLHMMVKRQGTRLRVAVSDGAEVCHSRPSVDVLFASVAQAAGKSAIGVLLTGMGKDGAQGLLRMRTAGALTIAQDEASCVVYGMPMEAVRMRAADCVLPRQRIAAKLVEEATR